MVRAKLYLSPKEKQTPVGTILTVFGSLVDAVTGKGIPFAPIQIIVNGVPIAVVPTGPDGRLILPIKLPVAGKYKFQGKFLGGEY